MARDPFKVDQVQIEPGSAGTRLIRKSADGSLEFLDIHLPGGLTLSQMAGLGTIQHVLVVGKSGAGAAYTTIQAALDAVPSSSSPTNPYLILIGPGVYQETLNIVRSGVYLLGMGAVLQSALEATPNAPGAYHTVVIQAALGSIPSQVVFINLTITNAHDNYACVRALGTAGSTVGLVGIRFLGCRLVANAAGGNRPIWATTIDRLTFEGGSLEDPTGLGLVLIQECASVTFTGVTQTPAFDLRWDVDETLPSEDHVGYFITGCSEVAVATSLSPAIALATSVAPDVGNLYLASVQGTEAPSVSVTNGVLYASDCTLGTVTLTGGLGYLRGCHPGSLTTAGGGKIARERSFGVASFVAEASKAVTFDARAMSSSFTVSLDQDAATAGGAWITNKTETGFTIHFGGAETVGVQWIAHHND